MSAVLRAASRLREAGGAAKAFGPGADRVRHVFSGMSLNVLMLRHSSCLTFSIATQGGLSPLTIAHTRILRRYVII